MIWELLKENIIFEENISEWVKAIHIAANPLLLSGSIQPRYIDAMIEMCEKYNSYIVLNDFFAMPHASYDNGVNSLGVSLLISRNEVDFSGKPVHLILVIAPENNTSHIELMKEVALYFADVNFINQLSRASSIQEVYKILNEVYGIEVILEDK